MRCACGADVESDLPEFRHPSARHQHLHLSRSTRRRRAGLRQTFAARALAQVLALVRRSLARLVFPANVSLPSHERKSAVGPCSSAAPVDCASCGDDTPHYIFAVSTDDLLCYCRAAHLGIDLTLGIYLQDCEPPDQLHCIFHVICNLCCIPAASRCSVVPLASRILRLQCIAFAPPRAGIVADHAANQETKHILNSAAGEPHVFPVECHGTTKYINCAISHIP